MSTRSLLFAILACTVKVMSFEAPGEVYTRPEEQYKNQYIESRIWTAPYTEIFNRPPLQIDPDAPGMTGPDLLQVSWNRDQLEQVPQNEQFFKYNITMYTFIESGKLNLTTDGKAKPGEKLPEEDLLWTLTCYHAVHKDSPAGVMYHQQIDLHSETKINPYKNDTWDSLKYGSHFYCPTAECVARNGCANHPSPAWQESVYGAEFAPIST